MGQDAKTLGEIGREQEQRLARLGLPADAPGALSPDPLEPEEIASTLDGLHTFAERLGPGAEGDLVRRAMQQLAWADYFLQRDN